jgi:hypothetical protein
MIYEQFIYFFVEIRFKFLISQLKAKKMMDEKTPSIIKKKTVMLMKPLIPLQIKIRLSDKKEILI